MKYSKEFNAIYENLKNGKEYGYIQESVNPIIKPYFSTVLTVGIGRSGKPLLFWQHFGSSANPFTKSDLYWLLDKIYKMTPIEFTTTYICR